MALIRLIMENSYSIGVQNDLDDLAQDYLNEKYNQEALYEYRK
jgi:hypothetical protein